MQQARPYVTTAIAIAGATSLIAVTPVAAPLPNVQVPAVQLTTDASPLGDLSSLFSDLTGATSGTGDLTGLLGGLNPTNLLSDLPGLGSSTDPTGIFGDLLGGLGLGGVGTDITTAAPTSLLTPYIDLFTDSFANLQKIGTEFADVTLPELEKALQAIIGNPSLIAELPEQVFSAFTSLGSITTGTDGTAITVGLMLGAPLVLGLAEVGPVATTSGALETYFADLMSGDPTTVLTTLIDGPANIANAYLNGSVGLDVLGINIPLLNGILVPDTSPTIDVDLSTLVSALNSIPGFSSIPALALVLSGLKEAITADPSLADTSLADITVGPFGGLVDALVNVIPQDILDPGGTSILSALDPSALLSGLDLGNLGGLLDSSSLVGDLTSLLPSAAADLATLIPF